MATNPEDEPQGKPIYIALSVIQAFGAVFLIGSEMPLFRQLLANPGYQPEYSSSYVLTLVCTLSVMQCAYWYRLLRISIPYRLPNIFLSHVFLFLGRLSFIFGGALFSVVFFRHIPELGPHIDVPVSAGRSLLLAASLFTLFCFTLELERLGNALGGDQNK